MFGIRQLDSSVYRAFSVVERNLKNYVLVHYYVVVVLLIAFIFIFMRVDGKMIISEDGESIESKFDQFQTILYEDDLKKICQFLITHLQT